MIAKTRHTYNGDILENLEMEMCDVVYRHLYLLMVSLKRTDLEIELDKKAKTIIRFWIDSSSSTKAMFPYVQEAGSTKKSVGTLNFSSSKKIEDSILYYILNKKEYNDCRPEIYKQWFENVALKMQNLLEEQKKYEDILENIRNIPMFTPKREVIIEKK